MVAGGLDLGQSVFLPGRHAIATHQVRHAGNGVQGRAYLMAHIGQEGALGAVGNVRCILGNRQIAGSRLYQLFEVVAVMLQFLRGLAQVLFVGATLGDIVQGSRRAADLPICIKHQARKGLHPAEAAVEVPVAHFEVAKILFAPDQLFKQRYLLMAIVRVHEIGQVLAQAVVHRKPGDFGPGRVQEGPPPAGVGLENHFLQAVDHRAVALLALDQFLALGPDLQRLLVDAALHHSHTRGDGQQQDLQQGGKKEAEDAFCPGHPGAMLSDIVPRRGHVQQPLPVGDGQARGPRPDSGCQRLAARRTVQQCMRRIGGRVAELNDQAGVVAVVCCNVHQFVDFQHRHGKAQRRAHGRVRSGPDVAECRDQNQYTGSRLFLLHQAQRGGCGGAARAAGALYRIAAQGFGLDVEAYGLQVASQRADSADRHVIRTLSGAYQVLLPVSLGDFEAFARRTLAHLLFKRCTLGQRDQGVETQRKDVGMVVQRRLGEMFEL